MAETDSVASSASDLRNAYFIDTSSNDNRSFSSPYTAQTLDQIPTPILKMLIVLGPTIRFLASTIQIITWRSSDARQSILALLLWIAFCLWTTQTLVFVIPSLILVKLGQGWLKIRTSRARREKMELLQQQKRKHNDNDEEEDDDNNNNPYPEELVSRKFQMDGHVSLDDTLQNLAIVNAFVDRVCHWTRYCQQEFLDGSRPEVMASTLSILLYAWPVWILLNYMLKSQGVFALVGALALLSASPWFKVMVMALRRNTIVTHAIAAFWAYGVALVISMVSAAIPFRTSTTPRVSWIRRFMQRARSQKSQALKVIQSEKEMDVQDAMKGTRSEMIFQFDLYENQRWWLGMDWTTNMMPSERAPWTDIQLAPVEAKNSFELPAASETVQYRPGKEGTIKQITRKVWSWADGDWWVDMTGEMQGRVDSNGWEYGNNAWKQMTGHRTLQTFTRRRRWSRRARLVERKFDEPVADHGGLRKRN